jgi:hypothetical protein
MGYEAEIKCNSGKSSTIANFTYSKVCRQHKRDSKEIGRRFKPIGGDIEGEQMIKEILADWMLSIPVLDRMISFLGELRSIKDCIESSYYCPRCGGWIRLRYIEGIPYALCNRCKMLLNFYKLIDILESEVKT